MFVTLVKTSDMNDGRRVGGPPGFLIHRFILTIKVSKSFICESFPLNRTKQICRTQTNSSGLDIIVSHDIICSISISNV